MHPSMKFIRPLITSPLDISDRIDILKAKRLKQLKMKADRLWEEENRKRLYSRMIKRKSEIVVKNETNHRHAFSHKSHLKSQAYETIIGRKHEIDETEQIRIMEIMHMQLEDAQKRAEKLKELDAVKREHINKNTNTFNQKLSEIRQRKESVNLLDLGSIDDKLRSISMKSIILMQWV